MTGNQKNLNNDANLICYESPEVRNAYKLTLVYM